MKAGKCSELSEKKSWKGKVATVTMAPFMLETVIHAC